MEHIDFGKKKKTFSRGFLIFLLGFLGLLGLSTGISWLLPDKMTGAPGKLALVEIKGVISDSTEIVRQLVKFRRDDDIRGIVLRINSPGGAVGPSQEIYDEVLRIRESGKMIFASLGSTAASGGYYIASPAHRVFANPGTLTGSIGVIMAFSNIEELMGKIGLRPEVVKSGEFKDSGSPLRPMTSKERKLLQGVVDDVHQQFVEAVARGRNLPIEEVKKVADGRIFTGRQAHRLKLVDQLGGLQETIDNLAEKVSIPGIPKIIKERERLSFLDFLLQNSIYQYVKKSMISRAFPTLQYLWPLGYQSF